MSPDYLRKKYWSSSNWDDQRLSLAIIQHGILADANKYMKELERLTTTVSYLAIEVTPIVMVNSEILAPGQDLLITLTPPDGAKTVSVSFNGLGVKVLENGDYQYSEKVKTPGRGKVEIAMIFMDSNAATRSFSKTVYYTVIAHAQGKEKLKTASMGYSYPYNIKRNMTRNINVYVTIHHSESNAKDTILRTLEEQKIMISGDDSDVVQVISIPVYQKVSVRLIDPDSLFHIKKIHDNDFQPIDTFHGNHWRWTISTSTDRPSATLVLKTHTLGPNEVWQDKNIVIPIIIDNKDYFRRLLVYLGDNPILLLTLLVLPIAGYFGKRLFDKKKDNQPNPQGGATAPAPPNP